ncbi:MAG: hypothetical protein LVR00_05625 [Rhabdochlamydiaceae bacterium]
MADNIAIAIHSLTGQCSVSKENGMTPPSHLSHRRHPNRVLIHHTSSAQKKIG